jgi:hypothetical protein
MHVFSCSGMTSLPNSSFSPTVMTASPRILPPSPIPPCSFGGIAVDRRDMGHLFERCLLEVSALSRGALAVIAALSFSLREL